MNFLVYHAGFDPENPELPFQPGAGRNGIDSLVQSLLDNDIAPNSNVYADLGTTWNMFRRDPDTAAHGMGKLLKYVGQDNVHLGNRLDLDRLAPGPDPGLAHLPDLRGVARPSRLSRDHARAAGEGLRPQRHQVPTRSAPRR